MTERTVSVTELKAKLSEQLRLVKSGETVLVTERNRPIAVLGPAPKSDTRLERLVRQGLVRPATGTLPDDIFDREMPKDPEGLALKALLEERRSGR